MINFRQDLYIGDRGGWKSGTARIVTRARKIIIAIAVLWILLAAIGRQRELSRIREARTATVVMTRATHAFFIDHERCPHDLEELVHAPAGKDPYLPAVSPDPWGNEYRLICPAQDDTRGVRVESAGPEGVYGGRRAIGVPAQ